MEHNQYSCELLVKMLVYAWFIPDSVESKILDHNK